MIRRMLLIFLLVVPLSCSTAIEYEVELLDGDFGYSLNDEEKTAKIKTIYIPINTKKDLEVPKFVKFHRKNYSIIGIEESAITNVLSRIKSFKAPEAFFKKEENSIPLAWLHQIPVISVSEEKWEPII